MTFVLAAVAGVAGNQLTGHLTWAVAVFAGLLAVGMTVTYLVERRAGGKGGRLPVRISGPAMLAGRAGGMTCGARGGAGR